MCILENQFQDSTEFLNFINKFIYKHGGDCGGGAVSILASCCNFDGDSGERSIPLNVVEKVSTSQSNLKNTIFYDHKK